jgi:hypothetical protein|tara:strand:- start:103 stop:600 length:498 start_codon:yes stop_codon:yes gene_type:complete
MDRQQINLKLVIEGLGLPFVVDNFVDRLILQKAVYLAQAGGTHLGYYYKWYLKGPYCSDLAEDSFAIRCEIDQDMDDSKRWVLDSDSVSLMETLKGLIHVDPSDKEVGAKRLELLASVHFLIDRNQGQEDNIPGMVATLKEFEKDFSEDQVSEALGELHEYTLLT